jgi:hypothetical protein
MSALHFHPYQRDITTRVHTNPYILLALLGIVSLKFSLVRAQQESDSYHLLEGGIRALDLLVCDTNLFPENDNNFGVGRHKANRE